MQAARLVINESNSTADHSHHKDGKRNRTRQQIFDVIDIRIDFYRIQLYLVRQARRHVRSVELLHHLLDPLQNRARYELVGIVLHKSNARAIAVVEALRKILGHVNDRADITVAKVFVRLFRGIIINHVKGARSGGNPVKHFTNLLRFRRIVHIHESDLDAGHLAAKCVAQHDQLHQRKNHGSHHQGRAAEEFAEIALDQRPYADEIHRQRPFAVSGSALQLTIKVANVIARSRFRRIPQIVSSVMHEDVVERGALHGNPSYHHASRAR